MQHDAVGPSTGGAVATEAQAPLLDLAHAMVRDLDDRITLWTAGMEQLYGWSAHEAVGKVSHDLLATQFPRSLEQVQAALLRDGQWEGEFSHRHRDGRTVVVASHWVLYRDAQGQPRCVLEVDNDITRQKQAEDALREADRRKDAFLAQLGHELRNPLSPIRNAVEVLRLSGAGGRELEWSRGVIERQVQHLTRLVDDLLDVSRIRQGKMSLQRQQVELAWVVAHAVETCRPLIDARRQELAVTLCPYPVTLEADPTRLAQVLSNLLANASKYTHEGGHITLTAEAVGLEVVLRVRDDGIGILPEMLPRVFELFTQGDRSRPHDDGGLGIGLTLVKGLAEMHGGTVTAHSQGPGKGSEFVVRLPYIHDRVNPATVPSGQVEQARGPSRRVLVVDDNIDTAESLAILLRLAGHEVQSVHEGALVLETARAFRPDVVVLDIGLPGGPSGYDLAARLRQEPGLNKVLLVAVTGYGQEEDKRRAHEAGFDAHLTKPANLEALSSLLVAGRCAE